MVFKEYLNPVQMGFVSMAKNSFPSSLAIL